MVDVVYKAQVYQGQLEGVDSVDENEQLRRGRKSTQETRKATGTSVFSNFVVYMRDHRKFMTYAGCASTRRTRITLHLMQVT